MFRNMMKLDPIEEETRPKPSNPNSKSQFRCLTEMQMRFVGAWTGNLVAAAKTAGYSDPKRAAYKLMKDPYVVKALQAKQESMLQESGEHLARTLPLSRADVIDRLWQLAQLDPHSTNGNINGQVKAAQTLEQVFALNIDHNDLLKRQLQGKSESELEFYVIHGFLPHQEQKPALEAPAEAPQLPESTVSIESSESIASTGPQARCGGSTEPTLSTESTDGDPAPIPESAAEIAEPVTQ
jgi:phage terminase small subunit